MDDVRAVLDAAGSERAALVGVSEGGPMSMLFAATYPERTEALLLVGAEVKEETTDDWPWGESTRAEHEAWMAASPGPLGQGARRHRRTSSRTIPTRTESASWFGRLQDAPR